MRVGVFAPGLNGEAVDNAHKAYQMLTYRMVEDRSTRWTWTELWVWQYSSLAASEEIIIVFDACGMKPTPEHILRQFDKEVSDCYVCRGESDLHAALTQLSGEDFPRRSR